MEPAMATIRIPAEDDIPPFELNDESSREQ
jgi:hypothetical protein